MSDWFDRNKGSVALGGGILGIILLLWAITSIVRGGAAPKTEASSAMTKAEIQAKIDAGIETGIKAAKDEIKEAMNKAMAEKAKAEADARDAAKKAADMKRAAEDAAEKTIAAKVKAAMAPLEAQIEKLTKSIKPITPSSPKKIVVDYVKIKTKERERDIKLFQMERDGYRDKVNPKERELIALQRHLGYSASEAGRILLQKRVDNKQDEVLKARSELLNEIDLERDRRDKEIAELKKGTEE